MRVSTWSFEVMQHEAETQSAQAPVHHRIMVLVVHVV